VAIQSNPAGFFQLGPRQTLDFMLGLSTGQVSTTNGCVNFIGHVVWADGGTHTIDTTGSSSLGWLSSAITFSNAATSVSVGLAPVETTLGPTARPVKVASVVSYDVKAVFAGGGGGITANAWQTSVPTAGTKTIANGDLVSFTLQMTVRGGSDSVQIGYASGSFPTLNRPIVSVPNDVATQAVPNVIITASDGTLGWIDGGDVSATAPLTKTWNNTSTIKEYGQLYQMPFPMNVCGVYGMTSGAVDRSYVIYSDPLGTPVAQRTTAVVGKTLANGAANFFYELFSTPYAVTANQPIGVVIKPTSASGIAAGYKTLQSASHRVSDAWGTSSYGISRNTGAFANINASLDHFYIGLLVSGISDGTGSGPAFSGAFVG
jgi:hypothetical protein